MCQEVVLVRVRRDGVFQNRGVSGEGVLLGPDGVISWRRNQLGC